MRKHSLCPIVPGAKHPGQRDTLSLLSGGEDVPAVVGLQQAMFSLHSNGLPCGAKTGSRISP